MKVDLQHAIDQVEKAVAAAEAEIGPREGAGLDWWDRHRDVMKRCGDDLTERLGARINDRWDGCRIRIAGVSSTCTAGMHGALKNWLRAAKARLDNQRAEQ